MNLLRYLPRFRRATRSLPLLESREKWSRQEIETYQLERLNTVWQHAIGHVPYYRHLAVTTGLPLRFASLPEFQAMVPVLSKPTIKAQPRAFLSEKAAPGRWGRTGGSTGTPMSAYWAKDAHLEQLRSKYRFYAMWGLDLFDPMAYLWGHSASFQPGLAGQLARWRQPMEDWMRNRLRLSAYNLGRDDVRNYLHQLASFRPAALYGYSRALYLLAREAETTGCHFETLKAAILTGEPAFPHLVDGIERAFGIPAVVEYGSVECGFLAGEWPDRTLRVREDGVLLETLPLKDGRYDIVVTVLSNPSFPLLRYAIEDVTDAPLDFPTRGFAILKNVAGRNNDLVVTRSGRYLHSARFDAFFKYTCKQVRRFRVRQHADGSLSADVEREAAGTALDKVEIEQKLKELVEGYPVKVEIVDAIPQTLAGKHRLVVSDLDLAGCPPVVHAEPGLSSNPSRVEAVPGQLAANGFHEPLQRTEEVSGKKSTQLRNLIREPKLSFIMEAHNGLSTKIVEEAGFEAIWASGLSISAALGVRDSNEASWTQVLEVLEFMNDATRLPLLVDGDTGYGNFNNMRRFVQKLEQRGIAGVCIEDKVFPKTNSFIRGTTQPLADIDEFCGRIKAGKDAQRCDDFVLVARVEALIAGWGLQEALKRAEAYRKAGADAILIHSAQRSANEILAFKEQWGQRLPVVIVPTKYYATPTDVFRKFGFSAVIWANHLMRSCITAMQRTAQEIFEDQNLMRVEDRVAPLAEVFRLQGASELEEAEKRYLPRNANTTRAIVLAAGQGQQLGALTENRPPCMVSIAGAPLLAHVANSYRAVGIKDLAVVRGYKKDSINLDGLQYYDCTAGSSYADAPSLFQALPSLEGPCLISYGHVLFKKYIAQELMDLEVDFAVTVDTDWRDSHKQGRPAQYVTCSEGSSQKSFCGAVKLLHIASEIDRAAIHGEWMGFLKLSEKGALFLRDLLQRLSSHAESFQATDMAGLLREIIKAGKEISVIYTTGHWLNIASVEDVLVGSQFQ